METTKVAIVGSGFAGIGAAIRLLQEGHRDFLLLDRGDEVGGTWRDNHYPGAACDIPSHLYSFSFARKPDWSHAYSRQEEILGYLRSLTDRFRLRPHLRLNTHVVRAWFDESSARWHLETAGGGEIVAETVIAALGPLRDPSYPPLPGREDFGGVQFHSARWNHNADLDDKRVGVVGTGASSIQFVPHIAEDARSVHVFQRSAPWIIPSYNRRFSRLEKFLFRWIPGLAWLYRVLIYWQKELRFAGFREGSVGMRLMESFADWHMRRHIDDPGLQEKLTPDYRMGCKRILLSNDYYPALAQDHVEVVTDPIAAVSTSGLVTGSGREIDVDAIIWGTGFRVGDPLGALDVTGVGGRSLRDVWDDKPSAFLGTTVPGFPNLFVMIGPNTGLGHNSMVFMMEAQYRYILGALETLAEPGIAYVDVRPEALADFEDEVTDRHEDLVWASGCKSWYLDEQGRNFTLWPGYTFEYWWRLRDFDVERYRVVHERDLPVGERPADREPLTACAPAPATVGNRNRRRSDPW